MSKKVKKFGIIILVLGLIVTTTGIVLNFTLTNRNKKGIVPTEKKANDIPTTDHPGSVDDITTKDLSDEHCSGDICVLNIKLQYYDGKGMAYIKVKNNGTLIPSGVLIVKDVNDDNNSLYFYHDELANSMEFETNVEFSDEKQLNMVDYTIELKTEE